MIEALDYEAPEWVVWIKRAPDKDGNEKPNPILAYTEKAPSFDAAAKKASAAHRSGFRENSFRIVLVALKDECFPGQTS